MVEHLRILGIDLAGGTRLPVIKVTPKFMHGSLSRGLTYEAQAGAEEIYLLPTDPPRGREIARWNSQRGEFSLKAWWKEADVLASNVPFGVLPEGYSWMNKTFRRQVYEGRTRLSGIAGLRGLNGRPMGSSVTRLEGIPVNAYRTTSTDSTEQQQRVLYTLDGQLAAEDYRHETVQVMKRFSGNRRPQLLGQERIYYDTTKTYRRPLGSVLTGVPERPGRPSARFGLTLREFVDMVFSTVKGQQRIQVNSVDREGMDYNVIHPQTSEYVEGRLVDRRRSDIPGSWLHDKKAWGLAKIVALGLLLLKIASWAVRLWGIQARSPGPRARVASRPATTAQAAVLEAARNASTRVPSNVHGFQTGAVQAAKQNLIALLEQRMTRGETFEDILQTYFADYTRWRTTIFNRHPAARPFTTEDLLLRFVLYEASANFSSCPSFLNYLFYKVREDAADPKDGAWAEGQIAKWHRILLANLGSRNVMIQKGGLPNASQEHFLIYQDVEGNFRSPIFLDAYDRDPGIVPDASVSYDEYIRSTDYPINARDWLRPWQSFKTFLERGGGFASIRGWLRVWFTHWKISMGYLVGLYAGLWQSGLITQVLTWWAGAAILAIALTAVWILLHAWVQPRGVLVPRCEVQRPDHRMAQGPGIDRQPRCSAPSWALAFHSEAQKLCLELCSLYLAPPGTWILMDSYWAFPGGHDLLLGLFYAMFIVFYFLMYSRFSISRKWWPQICSENMPAWGVFSIGPPWAWRQRKAWRTFGDHYAAMQQQFYAKMLPPALEKDALRDKKLHGRAFGIAPSIGLYAEDRLTEDEWRAYCYVLSDEPFGQDPDAGGGPVRLLNRDHSTASSVGHRPAQSSRGARTIAILSAHPVHGHGKAAGMG